MTGVGRCEAVAHGAPEQPQPNRHAARIDHDRGEAEFRATTQAIRSWAGGAVKVVEMQAEGSLEAEGGIGHRQARFGVNDPQAGIDQDSGFVHRLRLIGMEHGHLVEAALQSTGNLTLHERHRPRPGPDPDPFGRHRSKPAGKEMDPRSGQPMATGQPHRGELSGFPWPSQRRRPHIDSPPSPFRGPPRTTEVASVWLEHNTIG